MWSRVCSGTGTGSRLPYPGKTVPFSTGLRVFGYRNFGQVSRHMTLFIHQTYGTTFFFIDSGRQPPPLAPPSLQKRVEGCIFSFLATTALSAPSLASEASGGSSLVILGDDDDDDPSLASKASGGLSRFVLCDYGPQPPLPHFRSERRFILSRSR